MRLAVWAGFSLALISAYDLGLAPGDIRILKTSELFLE
jgi:hypothetical protein